MNEILKAKASIAKSKDVPKFKILANAGSRMSFPGRDDVIIDMENVKIDSHSKCIPILYAHDTDDQVGHANTFSINRDEGCIEMEANMSCDTERARMISSASENGFPWQASLGFVINEGEEVKAGIKEKVNGREEEGPFVRATDITIWECSVVTFGADGNTNANIVEQPIENSIEESKEMAEEKKEELIKAEATPDIKATVEVKQDVQSPAIMEAQASINDYREQQLADVERIKALRACSEEYNNDTFLAQAIKDGWSKDKFELETLRASRGSAPGIMAKEDNVDTKAVEVAFVRAAGFKPNERRYSPQVLEAADHFGAAPDFRELIEAATGFEPTYAQRRDGREWLQAASSTYSLGSLVTTTANAIMLAAWENIETPWRDIYKISSAPDFRPLERWRLATNFEFKEIQKEGEMPDARPFSDEMYKIQCKSYGCRGGIDWYDIVNGTALNVFSDTMKRFAYGADEAIKKQCWQTFLTPGTNWWDTQTDMPLNFQNLADATKYYVLRKRGKGIDGSDQVDEDKLINLKPTKLIVPPSLVLDAEMLTNATTRWNREATNYSADFNPHASYGWQIITTPELEDASYTGSSSTNWYMMCNQNDLQGFEIVFLNGNQAPVVRTGDVEIGRLGIQFDGHIEFGVSSIDRRAGVKFTA